MQIFQGLSAELIRDNEEEAELLMNLPADFSFFRGHFPGDPILPAFAIIEISLSVGRNLKLIEESFHKLPQAKFLSAIRPESPIKILVKKYKEGADFQWFQEEKAEWKKASELNF